MSIVKNLQPKSATQVSEPPLARFLFADTRMAWLWLIVRVYVGWQWLVAGIEKLTGYSIDTWLVRDSIPAIPGFSRPIRARPFQAFSMALLRRRVVLIQQSRDGMAGSSSTSHCRWRLDSPMPSPSVKYWSVSA